jgi:Holliday junction resolvase RusA-like endonuclease
MYTPSKKFGLVKSAKYRRIETNIPKIQSQMEPAIKFPVEIEIKVVEGYGFTDKSDIDNCGKAVVDALVRANIIPDDNIKYVVRVEEKFIPFWNKKSESITHITYYEPEEENI